MDEPPKVAQNFQNGPERGSVANIGCTISETLTWEWIVAMVGPGRQLVRDRSMCLLLCL